ncbi:MAG: hypothetical protein J0H68_05710 [Sphingobacteriia bacterium]|nr:hypothetical protein [Sphingobacteriia bacterium]
MNIKQTFRVVPQTPLSISNVIKGQIPTAIYSYYHDQDQLSFYVLRWDKLDPRTGKITKDILPYCYIKLKNGECRWVIKWPDFLRPLYNLPDILNFPYKPILIVEGEKVVEAARKAFSEWVVTTSSGGSNAADKSDWSILHNRIIYISYDCDKAGIKYRDKVIELLKNIGVKELHIIQTEKLWGLQNAITT